MHPHPLHCLSRLDDSLPSCYVTFQQADGAPVHTDTVPDSDQPLWGFEHEVKISAEVLDRQVSVTHFQNSHQELFSFLCIDHASLTRMQTFGQLKSVIFFLSKIQMLRQLLGMNWSPKCLNTSETCTVHCSNFNYIV